MKISARIGRTASTAGLVLAMMAVALPAMAQQTGHLRIESSPGRAGVFIDGDYVGPAKNHGSVRRYTLPAGSHEVTLRDSGHAEASMTVNVVAGETTTVSMDMEPLELAVPPFGNLRTRHPDKLAAVYINGMFVGHVDEFNNVLQGVQLNPGTYEVRILARNGAAVTNSATIVANETTIVGSN